MKLPQFKCNWCGCEYNPVDCCNNPFGVTHKFGYESYKYDRETLELDLCPECADKLIEYIRKQSTINCIK